MAKEKLQEPELFRRQLHRASSDGDLPGSRVERDIARAQHDVALLPGPPPQRADPCGELLEGERLDQVVIRARIEAGHPVREGIPRRQHEDGHHVPPGAKGSAHGHAIAPWEHQVEDHRIVGTGV